MNKYADYALVTFGWRGFRKHELIKQDEWKKLLDFVDDDMIIDLGYTHERANVEAKWSDLFRSYTYDPVAIDCLLAGDLEGEDDDAIDILEQVRRDYNAQMSHVLFAETFEFGGRLSSSSPYKVND